MISLKLIYMLDKIISQKLIVSNKKIERFTNEAPGPSPPPPFGRGACLNRYGIRRVDKKLTKYETGD
jgi:hypothetical protein